MRTQILTSLCLLSSYFLSSQYDDSKHRLVFDSGFGEQNIDKLLSDMNHNDAIKIRGKRFFHPSNRQTAAHTSWVMDQILGHHPQIK